MQRLSVGAFVLILACKSSSPAPIDPLAEDYCEDCCQTVQDGGVVPCAPGGQTDSCARVVNEALRTACPDETRTYYECVTENSCDTTACESEWAVREACMAPPDAGAGGGGGSAGGGGAGGGGGSGGAGGSAGGGGGTGGGVS